MKAYVLMTTDVGSSPAIQEELRNWGEAGGVVAVDAVAGTYDVVVVIEASDPKQIGELVMGKLQNLDGVRSTVTLLAIG